jgi:single-strand selective monofunctional uracil DNA glycosylase
VDRFRAPVRVRQRVRYEAVELINISRALCAQVERLSFAAPVAYVYNPLSYARQPHERYLSTWGQGAKQVLFVGMNPGPFGMAQTGVPFGDVAMVRDFLGITGAVQRPRPEHPSRPIQGFECARSEVSGTRLWGWVKQRFQTPQRFFKSCFVHNYCPLVFMEASAKNRTPDKLAKEERRTLYQVCDQALLASVDTLKPRWVIGVGAFAEERAQQALGDRDVQIATVLHPSPASPKANKGWASVVDAQLAALGIEL